MTGQARDELVAVRDKALVTLGELHTSWSLLREALVPGGRRHWNQRELTDTQREALDARAFRERAYKTVAIRSGLSALAPQSAAAAVHVVDVRAELQTVLADVAGELYGTARGRVLPAAPDPTARRHTIPCLDCDSSPVWRMLPEPDGKFTRCLGRCPVCRSPSACDCGPADARISQALGVIGRFLPAVRDLHQAKAVARELARAEKIASSATGVDPQPHMLIRVACPACHERGLQLTADDHAPETWAITCTNRSCRCTGPGCPCGRTSRYRAGEHRWMAASNGWRELSDVLDVQSRAHFTDQLPGVSA